jgi:hypothetical protein
MMIAATVQSLTSSQSQGPTITLLFQFELHQPSIEIMVLDGACENIRRFQKPVLRNLTISHET